MFIEGDIFKINDIEYRIRFINKHNICWLEPVIYRNDKTCITGGLNRTYHIDELTKLEYMNISY